MENTIITRINEIAEGYMAKGVPAGQAFELATRAVELEQAQTKSTRTRKPAAGTGSAAPQPKAEKVEFQKRNGDVIMVTPKQAAAMEAWRSNGSGKTLDEVKALKPEITEAGRAYVKANPSCTRKEAAANGCKNITKDGLKALKRELGVR